MKKKEFSQCLYENMELVTAYIKRDCGWKRRIFINQLKKSFTEFSQDFFLFLLRLRLEFFPVFFPRFFLIFFQGFHPLFLLMFWVRWNRKHCWSARLPQGKWSRVERGRSFLRKITSILLSTFTHWCCGPFGRSEWTVFLLWRGTVFTGLWKCLEPSGSP